MASKGKKVSFSPTEKKVMEYDIPPENKFNPLTKTSPPPKNNKKEKNKKKKSKKRKASEDINSKTKKQSNNEYNVTDNIENDNTFQIMTTQNPSTSPTESPPPPYESSFTSPPFPTGPLPTVQIPVKMPFNQSFLDPETTKQLDEYYSTPTESKLDECINPPYSVFQSGKSHPDEPDDDIWDELELTPPSVPSQEPKYPPPETSSKSVQVLKMEDALGYLSKVKSSFSTNSIGYQNFLKYLDDFKHKRISVPSLINKIIKLFDNNIDLIYNFNIFLPNDYKITKEYIHSQLNKTEVSTNTPYSTLFDEINRLNIIIREKTKQDIRENKKSGKSTTLFEHIEHLNENINQNARIGRQSIETEKLIQSYNENYNNGN